MRFVPSIHGAWSPSSSRDGGLAAYLREVFSAPLLTADEEFSLAVSWRDNGDHKAAHRLVLSHLRLVPKLAARYKHYGLPFADLISEGNIGLMQAVRNFDPRKGFRLVTYALWWIRASIQDYVLRSWSLVKVTATGLQKRLFFGLRGAKLRIGAMDGNLTDEQAAILAQELGTTKENVQAFDVRALGDLSLDAPLDGGSGGARTLQDSLASQVCNPEELVQCEQDRVTARAKLARAMRQLSKRERLVVWARHLRDGTLTLEALSRALGVSRERVRQIEEQALRKMRALCSAG